MSSPLRPPRKLPKDDDRSSFSSGAAELDDWFARFAWENLRAGNAVTYVVEHEQQILGYYAIAAVGVSTEHVPASFGARRPTDIPCVLLARLAVASSVRGRGLGVALFRDAIERSVLVSESIGAACLLVHARDDAARDFYLAHADLLPSPVEPLHLILPMKVAKSFVGH